MSHYDLFTGYAPEFYIEYNPDSVPAVPGAGPVLQPIRTILLSTFVRKKYPLTGHWHRIRIIEEYTSTKPVGLDSLFTEAFRRFMAKVHLYQVAGDPAKWEEDVCQQEESERLLIDKST